MPNLHDYVRWRGDLPFDDDAFNIVDNLVLAALANVELGDLVPPLGGGAVTLQAVGRALTEQEAGTPRSRRLVFVPPALVVDAGSSRRFGEALLSGAVDITDAVTGTQFAAVTVALPDGSSYVAFRGTDNSLVGWREDFTLSFDRVPAQTSAAAYLREVLATTSGPVRVGGHSKGGHLAVFAALSTTPADRERIVHVYDNDGPGLSPEITDLDAREVFRSRTTKIVPEFAVIGRLFESGPASLIVASTGKGIVQHDIMTWQVEGTHLVERATGSARAATVSGLIDAWLEDAAHDDRRDFTDALFTALGAGGATLVQDVARRDHGSFESVLFSLVRSRSETRRSLGTTVRVLRRAVRRVDASELLRRGQMMRGALLVVVGVLFVEAPVVALQVLGAFATFVVSVVVAVRLLRYAARYRKEHEVRWPWIAGGVFAFALLLVGLANVESLVTPTNLLLGAALIAAGCSSAKDGFPLLYRRPRRGMRGALLLISAAVAVLMGIVALVTADRVMSLFVLQVGLYFIVAGLVEMLFTVHDRVRRAYVDESAIEDLAKFGDDARVS
ncbi:uncharacterized membrane protein HdeD (DUF308 family) [Frigoribacterium sp. PhB160]|uniref:Mbeg1-like protein n=1 Tax=Frigoribacterium sp. PhB160 TaxID=2485192 RepID=UPI000F477110|nr:Mbeg1-like protein [Frigoribacterium sp. PhB160]ROS61150.1 uncharacterized membrane protein HdeD (DUF308 family) [Frigoribacterium sp. PhB160]